MQNPFFDMMTRWNKIAVKAGTELLQINADAFSKIGQKQADLVSGYLALSREQLESVSKINKAQDVSEFLGEQAEQFKNFSNQMLADGKEMAQLTSETCQQVNGWMEKSAENGWSCLRTQTQDKAAA